MANIDYDAIAEVIADQVSQTENWSGDKLLSHSPYAAYAALRDTVHALSFSFQLSDKTFDPSSFKRLCRISNDH